MIEYQRLNNQDYEIELSVLKDLLNRDFKIGDEVMIKETSEFYIRDRRSNPINTRGIISWIVPYRTDLSIIVDWDNDILNVYSKEDLILLKK